MISILAKFIFLRFMGWRIEGEFPTLEKFILSVFPHTRSMDFIVGILTRAVLKEKINYVGKKELFNPITSWFFRALGGAPINRGSNENKVSAIAKIFNEKKTFRMAIAPEGTRKKDTFDGSKRHNAHTKGYRITFANPPQCPIGLALDGWEVVNGIEQLCLFR